MAQRVKVGGAVDGGGWRYARLTITHGDMVKLLRGKGLCGGVSRVNLDNHRIAALYCRVTENEGRPVDLSLGIEINFGQFVKVALSPPFWVCPHAKRREEPHALRQSGCRVLQTTHATKVSSAALGLRLIAKVSHVSASAPLSLV